MSLGGSAILLTSYLMASVLVAIDAGVTCAQQPVGPTNEKLLTEAHAAWRAYEGAAREWSVRVTDEFSITNSGRTTGPTAAEAVIRTNPRCISIEETDPGDNGADAGAKTRLAKVYGPEYEFKAQKSAGNPGWALMSILEHKDLRAAIRKNEIPADRRTLREDVEAEHLLIAVAVENYLVRQVIDHACCRTERFAATGPPGGPVEWSFSIDSAKRPKNMTQVVGGRVTFDPTNSWVIRDSALDTWNGVGGITTFKKTFSYRPTPAGVPLPVEVKTEAYSDDGTYKLTWVSRREPLAEEVPPPDAKFTLSAYGIPEVARAQTHLGGVTLVREGDPPPGAPTGRQTPLNATPVGWYIPLTIAGVALIAVSLVIRFVVARRGVGARG